MNWISVKHRLPTEEESMRECFIVTVEIDICGNISREVYCDVGYGRSGWYDYDSEYEIVIPIERNSTKVVAWAFSPEPYQGE